MARKHCSPGTAYLLEVAENSETRPWHDFRKSPDALAAQAEHEQHRRNKEHAHKRKSRDTASDAAENPEVMLQSRSLAAALKNGVDAGREGLLLILVQAFRNRKPDNAAVFVLQRAFQEVFSTSDRSSILTVLRVCHEDELGHALAFQNVRDRRALQIVFTGLFNELGASGQRLLDDTPVADIVAASTSLHLVLETLRLKKWFDPAEDGQIVERTWRNAFSAYANDTNGWTSDVTIVSGLQLSKKYGGPRMAELLTLLRWAMAMQNATPTWPDMVTDICRFAAGSRFGHRFVEVARSKLKPLPVQVETILEGTLEDSSQTLELSKKVIPNTSGSGRAVQSTLPKYILVASMFWVSEDESMGDIRRTLEHAIESSSSEDPILVGMDTEWGERASGDPNAAPSVVQIAAVGKVWVLDTASPGPQTRSLIRWIFNSRHFQVVGFAFSHDIQRLAALAWDGSDSTGKDPNLLHAEIIDIQRLAERHVPRGATPGLKAVSETWLGKTIDKTEQCSDWDLRPLSASQLRYAAIDAAVLLDIAHVMGLRA
jgi:hypothetical protein